MNPDRLWTFGQFLAGTGFVMGFAIGEAPLISGAYAQGGTAWFVVLLSFLPPGIWFFAALCALPGGLLMVLAERWHKRSNDPRKLRKF